MCLPFVCGLMGHSVSLGGILKFLCYYGRLRPRAAIDDGLVAGALAAPPAELLEKNGTPALSHWSRRLRAHSGSIGLAARPLSPPAITHCTSPASSQGLRSTGPSSGSADTNRIGAGTRASTVNPRRVLLRLYRRSHPHVRGPFVAELVLGTPSTTRPPDPAASSAPGRCGPAHRRPAASRRRCRTRIRTARAGGTRPTCC